MIKVLSNSHLSYPPPRRAPARARAHPAQEKPIPLNGRLRPPPSFNNVSVPKDSGRFECIPPHSFPLPPARRGMQGMNAILSPIHFLSPGAKCVHVQRRFQTEMSFLLRGNPVFQKTEFLQIQCSLKMISNAETIV